MTIAANSNPIVVRRYARSRLYDTRNLCYVSLEILRAWSAGGIAFRVIDVETDTDVTHVLLA